MRRSTILLTAFIPLLCLIVLLHVASLQASPSQSSVTTLFTVNSNIDDTDINPGDGVCETDVGNGICTLRAAVQETNALSGSDVVNLPAGVYTITIPGQDFDAAVGDLNITDSLTILGEGITNTVIDGNDIDQIFDIRMAADKEVTLSQLTVRNGSTADFGGGICHCTVDTKLYLDHVLLVDNVSFGSGGGFYNAGYVEISNTVIQGNSGGHSGGGVTNSGTAVISKTNIISNTSPNNGQGGGISNSGTITMTKSTVQHNSVEFLSFPIGNGGGIFNGGNGEITIEDSTINGNSSGAFFGGFVNNGGVAKLVNVTVSENDPGGILQLSGGGTHITNTTIVSNMHVLPSQVSLSVAAGSAELVNTIIAGETSADNCNGSVTSLGHNLESGSSCGLSNTGDMTNTNPLVGPLQPNGGDTWTHALLPGSPAIDAGNDLVCPATDQRGMPRPAGMSCDMGAFEYELVLTAMNDEATTLQYVAVLIDVLANDIPGPNGQLILDVVGIPMSGTAVISGTFVLYTPALDFTGTDVFSYTITDSILTDTAVITVTVLPGETEVRIYLPVIVKPSG